LLPAIGLAIAKAACAFAVSAVLAKFVVRPLFELVARSRNEELFTAMALLTALAAALATATIGLSLTLGAFLGGMMLAETPYRAIIQSEIKPFRGLLLGFFFISVGLALDLKTLSNGWLIVIAITSALLLLKILTTAAAGLVFRWSIPGSVQIGFLLAQGSEFAIVIFSLPAVRALIGEERSALLIAAIALSIAVTPNLADLGRALAGRLRQRRALAVDRELQPQEFSGPVLIAGMGPVGRAVADALSEFEIDYAAIENDPQRFRDATADGYDIAFGDIGDPRIWEPMAMSGRKIIVLTEPSFDVSSRMTPIAERFFPDLIRVAVIASPEDAARFAGIGLAPIVDEGEAPGIEVATEVLRRLGTDEAAVVDWARRRIVRDQAPALNSVMG
jgi:CPA2 family monovalent cation:H+ antiporter-2